MNFNNIEAWLGYFDAGLITEAQLSYALFMRVGPTPEYNDLHVAAGKKVLAGQRWLFDNGPLKYLAEIQSDTSMFKILVMISPDSSHPTIVLNAILPHKSLLTGGDSWNYLESQEAPK